MKTLRRMFLAILLAIAAAAIAQSAQDRGLAIAREADRRESGFGDFEAELEMTLRNRHGQQSVRRLRVRTLEQKNDGDKALVYFDEPADVRGTTLLTFSHKAGNDDQWLYLPAIGRVKRISSTNKTGPFMGSEFSYEDISSQEVEEYTYRFLREEALDGQPCFVIERRPLDSRSGYTRELVWIDRAEYRTMRVDFFDRKDELFKTLRQDEFVKYAGRFWKPGRMLMVNHQTGKSTNVRWKRYQFGMGHTDAVFDPSRLTSAY